jgi:hypothetical protein
MADPQENIVTLRSWPTDPVNVAMANPPERPFNVNMNMSLLTREVIPLCIKVCEPICARSEYTIGIDIFDRPVAAITVKGQTRLFNCKEEG